MAILSTDFQNKDLKLSDLPIIPFNQTDFKGRLENNPSIFGYANTTYGTRYIKENYQIPLNLLRDDLSLSVGLKNLKPSFRNVLKFWHGDYYNENKYKSYVSEFVIDKYDPDAIPDKFSDLENSLYFLNNAPIPYEEIPIDPHKDSNKIVDKKYIDERFCGITRIGGETSATNPYNIFNMRNYPHVMVLNSGSAKAINVKITINRNDFKTNKQYISFLSFYNTPISQHFTFDIRDENNKKITIFWNNGIDFNPDSNLKSKLNSLLVDRPYNLHPYYIKVLINREDLSYDYVTLEIIDRGICREYIDFYRRSNTTEEIDTGKIINNNNSYTLFINRFSNYFNINCRDKSTITINNFSSEKTDVGGFDNNFTYLEKTRILTWHLFLYVGNSLTIVWPSNIQWLNLDGTNNPPTISPNCGCLLTFQLINGVIIGTKTYEKVAQFI